ncbi:MAG: oligoribonuclease [Flaviflexus sp.]|nr:oligoribonuclease [Flaviflexus sp.]
MSSPHARTNPIVWIDCEMTGLDERDELIEIAIVVTDSELNPLDEGIDLVIKPSDEALENMGDFVRNMHVSSGLLPELEGGMTLAEATEAALSYLRTHVPKGIAPLAGNSVATDKFFLMKDTPEIVDYLHYRIIDVSSIKELAKRWYPTVYNCAPDKTGNHRAIGDIFDSIDELRYYRSALLPAEDLAKEAAHKTAKQISDDRARERVSD